MTIASGAGTSRVPMMLSTSSFGSPLNTSWLHLARPGDSATKRTFTSSFSLTLSLCSWLYSSSPASLPLTSSPPPTIVPSFIPQAIHKRVPSAPRWAPLSHGRATAGSGERVGERRQERICAGRVCAVCVEGAYAAVGIKAARECEGLGDELDDKEREVGEVGSRECDGKT
ncbi:hypothetical protein BV22DRAFT_1040229 [Leucogyrophana mollusca]|uniref:Uncharacterized protein n=1 Tax=Leucogyrophana mollusca TaxID=85980 RepID=A0ACB8B324_9AGAM|nr:hypothetical protein BV22DRAFT_1040229 [Leucogyrophana mollusca]